MNKIEDDDSVELKRVLDEFRSRPNYRVCPPEIAAFHASILKDPDPEMRAIGSLFSDHSNAELSECQLKTNEPYLTFLPMTVLQYYLPRIIEHILDDPESGVINGIMVRFVPPVKPPKRERFLKDKIEPLSGLHLKLMRHFFRFVAAHPERFGDRDARDARRALDRFWNDLQ